jgi:hypothetical protein
MTEWTPDELGRIGGTEELELASARRDGTLRPVDARRRTDGRPTGRRRPVLAFREQRSRALA